MPCGYFVTLWLMKKEKNQNTNYLYPFIVIVLLFAVAVILIKPQQAPSSLAAPDNFIASWTQVNRLQIPRRALAAVAVNNYIYAIGGIDVNGKYVKKVEYAKIRPDGLLEPWQITSSLNEGRFYLAATTVNGFVYAIGGGSGSLGDQNQPTSMVEKAKILSGGNLGPWEIEHQMTTARRGLKVVAFGKKIFALGGYNGTFLKSIEHTTVSESGTLSDWAVSSDEALVDRYIHSAAIHENNLYLLGGHVRGKNKMSYGDVERTKILAETDHLPWQIEKTRLLAPRFIAS